MPIKRSHRRSQLIVKTLNAGARRGVLQIGPLGMPCALGRGGIRARKREGDGATPRGSFLLHRVLYNPTRGSRPRTNLPVRAMKTSDGWCDAPDDRNYNRPVRLPYPASAEGMWRSDHLYDVVIILNHNMRPRIRRHGSAVFMHIARAGYQPTEGCVAISAPDMKRLLAQVGRRTVITIAR